MFTRRDARRHVNMRIIKDSFFLLSFDPLNILRITYLIKKRLNTPFFFFYLIVSYLITSRTIVGGKRVLNGPKAPGELVVIGYKHCVVVVVVSLFLDSSVKRRRSIDSYRHFANPFDTPFSDITGFILNSLTIAQF